jgi:predicted RNA-binding Zn-ribbon protein involved in translation (DUF1610 family)
MTLTGLTLACFGLAAFLFVRQVDPYAGVPTDESTWVNFVCGACGARFHLNGRELQRELDRLAAGPKGSGATTFRCKACGAESATRVVDEP